MSRVLFGLAASALMGSVAVNAHAADWGAAPEPVFKPSYPAAMVPIEDSLTFEAGMRYFYGIGGQNTEIGGLDYTADEASHFLELHGRIDDHSTNTYLKGNIGFAAIIDGTYDTPATAGSVDTDSGTIAYGGADFGYLPFGNESGGFGAFIGYQYLNESLDIGRANFLTAGGGGDSEPNLLEVHGLRLGVTGQANINDVFDVRVDVAAIPYAYLTGTYGALSVAPEAAFSQGSAATITGHLYGGAIDAMVGFRATENLKIRAGARGYYLRGPTETYFEVREIADPSNEQGFRTSGTTELFRWGPVVEVTGTF